MTEPTRHIVNLQALPEKFPTHKHDPAFWESLGRAVATFGFLEEILAKAIFAFTATTPYSEEEAQKAFEKWLPQLQRALSDQLWNLIESYDQAVRENPDASIENLDDLIRDLKKAAKIRNVICHGSWRSPDAEGKSIPFFVNRQHERFDTAIDVAWLAQLQKHVSELICAVINTVTHMGWQFPGSAGPGKVITLPY
ncbi:MAG TPA: hypothetical protein DDZ40_05950 [Deltaproteobacteria bacterium]|nr:hypothetical protein [Deltaproteobacteria bacterium]